MEGMNNELPRMEKQKYEAVPEETVEGIAALVTKNIASASPEDRQAIVNIIVAGLPKLLEEAKAKREEVKTIH